jgi:hypothetical protein
MGVRERAKTKDVQNSKSNGNIAKVWMVRLLALGCRLVYNYGFFMAGGNCNVAGPQWY